MLDSGIVGPPGTRDVTVPIDPYPSDHRAVVSTVRFTPAAPGSFASVLHRRVERGDPIGVRYAAPRGEGVDTVRIVRHRGRPGDALMILPPQEASFYGALTFGSGGLKPGRYDAILVTRGNRVLSRSDFWVVRRNAAPRVRAHQRGRRVRVAWHNAPGYRRDWIGIWKRGDNDLYNDYLSFAYTEASVAGVDHVLRARARTLRRAADDGRRLRRAGAGVVHRRTLNSSAWICDCPYEPVCSGPAALTRSPILGSRFGRRSIATSTAVTPGSVSEPGSSSTTCRSPSPSGSTLST